MPHNPERAKREVASVDQVTIGSGNTIIGNAHINWLRAAADVQEDDEREIQLLRQRVQQFWIEGVLQHSLHGKAMVALGKAPVTNLVDHPWRMVLDIPSNTFPLQEGESISAVYRKNGRALLILGEPGSGKTTSLLDLAREQLEASTVDSSEAVPIILNLSTWGAKRSPLLTWAAQELNEKYHVPRNMARRWLEQRRLVLLLDGLDELERQHRTGCVVEINRFLRRVHAPGLAVCCRSQDYVELSVRLALEAAITLEPLSSEQIDSYLAGDRTRLSGLREALAKDSVLRELAASPLLLDLMTLSYGELLLDDVQGTEEAKLNQYRQRLLDAFITKMVHHRGRRDTDPADADLVAFLSTLARDMARQSETVFLLERLQPSYLIGAKSQVIYILLSRMFIALTIGIALGVSAALSALFIPLISYGMHGEQPDWANDPNLFWQAMRGAFVFVIFPVVILGLFASGYDILRILRKRPTTLEPAGTVAALLVVLNYCTVLALTQSVLFVVVFRRDPPPTALFVALVIQNTLQNGIPLAVVLGLRHLRPIQSEIRTVEAVRWSFRFTRTGTALGIVSGALAGVLIPTIAAQGFGVEIDVAASLLPMTGIGAACGSALGFVIGGFQPRVAHKNLGPNGPIFRSLRTSLLAAFLSLLTIVCMLSILSGKNLAKGFFLRLNTEDGVRSLTVGVENTEGILLLYALCLAFWLGSTLSLKFGGADVLAHYVLRCVLRFDHQVPLRLLPLLDRATDRFLLRRAGGGYMFTHRVLRDHLAGMMK